MNGLEKCMNFGKIQDFLLLTYIGACQGPVLNSFRCCGQGDDETGQQRQSTHAGNSA
jgi:hypothetical protein